MGHLLQYNHVTQDYDVVDIAGSDFGSSSDEQIDYVERSTDLTIAAGTQPDAETFIESSEKDYDGETRICVEFDCPLISVDQGEYIISNLWEDDVDLGIWSQSNTPDSAELNMSMYRKAYLIPSEGPHIYSIKVWKTGGTAKLLPTSGTRLPAFLRISKSPSNDEIT